MSANTKNGFIRKILKYNYKTGLIAYLLKTPLGTLSVIVTFGLVSMIGLFMFGSKLASEHYKDAGELGGWIIKGVIFGFAFVTAFGSLKAELSRKKYKKRIKWNRDKDGNQLKDKEGNEIPPKELKYSWWEKTFGDTAYVIGMMLFLTDCTLSLAGWSSFINLEDVTFSKKDESLTTISFLVKNFNTLAIYVGVFVFALIPPNAVKRFGALFAKEGATDDLWKEIQKSFRLLVINFIKELNESDNDTGSTHNNDPVSKSTRKKGKKGGKEELEDVDWEALFQQVSEN